MRGHAKGPFSLESNLEVQNVLILSPTAGTKSVYIEASPTNPVLLTITPSVGTPSSGGTNTLKIGTSTSAEAYYASGDVDPTSAAGIKTIRQFVLVANTTLTTVLSTTAVKAAKALTISAITGADTQTVVIGGQTYTFNTSLTNTANNVLIGASAGAMGDNLAAAINAGTGAGTLYGVGTVANASVTAVSNGSGVVTVTAITGGTTGNSIAISETLTNGAWAGGATVLSGGSNASTVGQITLFLNV